MNRPPARGLRVTAAAGSLLVAALLAAALLAAPAFEVAIVEPLAGQAAFGPTDFAAEVRGGEARWVEFYVDGRKVGERTAPPYRIEVDLGEENLERRFRVVAHGEAGAVSEAELVLPRIRVYDRIELPLQQLYVTASRAGGPAHDLARGHFRVFDGGVSQRLVTFERGDVPLAAVLLLDSSLSMRGAPLAAALAGARAFAAGMAPLDEAMLLLFSDQVIHRSAFGSDPATLTGGLTGAAARGGSAINDHLFLALKELERRQGRRVAILLSDGIDVDSLLSARELEQSIGRSPALLYWIRPASKAAGPLWHRSAWRDFKEHDAEVKALERMVARSGGRIVPIARIEQAEEAFREILTELRNQYVLGYYPSVARHDGSWRRIRIDLALPGIDLRAREGYYDD